MSEMLEGHGFKVSMKKSAPKKFGKVLVSDVRTCVNIDLQDLDQVAFKS